MGLPKVLLRNYYGVVGGGTGTGTIRKCTSGLGLPCGTFGGHQCPVVANCFILLIWSWFLFCVGCEVFCFISQSACFYFFY